MHEDAHLEMDYENRSGVLDLSYTDAQDFAAEAVDERETCGERPCLCGEDDCEPDED